MNFEPRLYVRYNGRMTPTLLFKGGPIVWLLLLASAGAIAIFVERLLHYHRAQINTTEFLFGLRNVLRQKNVIEALSICDAAPGPVARLVKTALLNREKSRAEIKEAMEQAGALEVARLEERLNLLATIAQLAPLLGLLGTVLGFVDIFQVLQKEGLYAHAALLSGGVWKALISSGVGLAVAIPAYAGHNYLVGEVSALALDMEKTSIDALNLLSELGAPAKS